jgi:hypothetical protein
VQRHAPLLVVVGEVEFRRRPGTAGGCGHGWMVSTFIREASGYAGSNQPEA